MSTWIMFALVGSVAPSAAPSTLVWQSDYSTARELSAKQQKPLAVFVGAGSDGWSGLVSNGSLEPQLLQAMANDYVLVYADRKTEMGKTLADKLEVANSTGLVISDRSGKVQAFYHNGSMGSTDLQRTLERYADPQRVVSTTETMVAPSSQARTMTSSVTATSTGTLSPAPTYTSGPIYAPAYAPAPVYSPVPYYYPTVSSCPNGKCPNAR